MFIQAEVSKPGSQRFNVAKMKSKREVQNKQKSKQVIPGHP